jgi:hypothetical protein
MENPAKPEVVELMPVRVSTARPLQSAPEPNKPVSLREWDQGQAPHKKRKLERRVLDDPPSSMKRHPACSMHIHDHYGQESTRNLKGVLGVVKAHCKIWHALRQGDRNSK